MINKITDKIEKNMIKTIKYMKDQFNLLDSNRINPKLFANIKIKYHNSYTDLQSIASITILDTHYLVIKPFDKLNIINIEKSLSKIEMCSNLSNNGSLIKVILPKFTYEMREKMSLKARTYMESAKISLRQIRRNGKEVIGSLLKNKEIQISKNEILKLEKKIDLLTKNNILTINKMFKIKESNLLNM